MDAIDAVQFSAAAVVERVRLEPDVVGIVDRLPARDVVVLLTFDLVSLLLLLLLDVHGVGVVHRRGLLEGFLWHF